MHARSPDARAAPIDRARRRLRLHRRSRSSGPRESTYAATATWAGGGRGIPGQPPTSRIAPQATVHAYACGASRAEPSRKRATSSVRAGRRGDDRAPPHHPIQQQQQLARFTATCAVLVVSHVVGPSVSGRARERGRTTTSHLNLNTSWSSHGRDQQYVPLPACSLYWHWHWPAGPLAQS
jgi:hypothetical protein